jgi:hypothetical protein
MKDEQVVVKTINKSFSNKIKAGITWFKLIAALNDIKLTPRELELLAFINYRGTISSLQAKEEFCRVFGSSIATISNMTKKTSNLWTSKLLVRINSKIKINPAIRVDFDSQFVARLFFNVENQVEDGDQG